MKRQRLNWILTVVLLLLVSGCTRSCQQFDRQFQVGSRNYDIKQYSGGRVVEHYQFRGVLNDSEGSDGYYWTEGDTLYEMSGDLSIRSWE